MTRQFRFVRPFLVSMFILLSLSRPAAGQEVMFPHGDLSDSAFAYAAGVDALTHAFGADTLAYPNEFPLPSTFPAFSAVFDLYLTDSVSDRWSKSEWEDIIGAIMNNDTTDTNDDVFGIVWGYFAREGADSNAAHAGVRFNLWGTTYTNIELVMYDTSDLPCPCTSEYGAACNGWSSYGGKNRLLLNASDSTCPPGPGCLCAPISVDEMLGLGIAHELQHLCYAISGGPGYGGGPNSYDGVNESLSTLAEYLVNSWRSLAHDTPYDASFMNREPC